jgi:DNA repair photolyase
MLNEITAKTILRRHKRMDSWFISRCGMNLYRGCSHACVYCDGRDEKYRVDGEFGRDVAVKTNALEILKRELDPARKRKPFRPGLVMLGGGVGDSYQPAEEAYELSRGALGLIRDFGHPVHILTKSTLVERDLDIIREINDQSRAVVSFSFSSLDPEVAGIFEPGLPEPAERLEIMRRFKKAGINCGMFLMPVIPFLTDTPEQITRILRAGKQAGADFVVFSGMTLKDGIQKDHFMRVLEHRFPQLLHDYITIYTDSPWGETIPEYFQHIHAVFSTVVRTVGLPVRMPRRLFDNLLHVNDKVAVLLEHIEYLLRLKGAGRTPFGPAAHAISKITEPLTAMRLQSVDRIGPAVAREVRAILETGTSPRYEELMAAMGR